METYLIVCGVSFFVGYCIYLEMLSDFEITRTIYEAWFKHVYKGKHFNF